jgi:hypothetical protein
MAYSIYTTTPTSYGNITVNAGTSGSNLIWNGTGASTNWSIATHTTATPVTMNPSGRIDLKGDNADVVINGESLLETLQAIKDALKIPGRIQQNAKLEESFEELRMVREKYESLVKEYQEKQLVWDTLKEQDL